MLEFTFVFIFNQKFEGQVSNQEKKESPYIKDQFCGKPPIKNQVGPLNALTLL